MSGDGLAEIIANFRKMNSRIMSPDQDATLTAIEKQRDVPRFWDKYFRHISLENSEVFLWQLLELKFLADNNHNSPQWREHREKIRCRTLDAIKEVDNFFRSTLVLASDNGQSEASMMEAHKQKRAGLTALAWAKKHVEHLMVEDEKAFDIAFPRSQKRRKASLAYGVLLCRELRSRFGRPGYELSAAMVGAVYPSDELLVADNIRKAFSADQKKSEDLTTAQQA